MTKKESGRHRLESELQNGYRRMDGAELPLLDAYCERYKAFLSASRTERATVKNAVSLAESRGFRPYTSGMTLKSGDRVYYNNRGRALCLAVIGTRPLAQGMTITAAHIDSPRLDVRPRPLYETDEIAYLKTHYYGWVRKYQWVAIPLMLQGVVILRSGEAVSVSIGDSEGDPRLVVTDLLPHLSGEQDKLPLSKAHSGETMNLLAGSRPLPDCDETKAAKLQALEALHQKYGISEDDLISAELEAVPAFPVCDVGLDRSLIGAYGQDDRVCAYAALDALLELGVPGRTAVCIMADKEEVGNNGVSGMRSASFDYFLEGLCRAQGCGLRQCYENSFCLSADVTSAYDPNYADAFEPLNTARVNHGLAVCKYTGFKGKEQASDASAELVGYVRQVFDSAGVIWQPAEMGRIDLGGGGTVALELANRGIDTLDAGVPVLSMHAPFETVSKLDCYMMYKACKALYEA